MEHVSAPEASSLRCQRDGNVSKSMSPQREHLDLKPLIPPPHPRLYVMLPWFHPFPNQRMSIDEAILPYSDRSDVPTRCPHLSMLVRVALCPSFGTQNTYNRPTWGWNEGLLRKAMGVGRIVNGYISTGYGRLVGMMLMERTSMMTA